MYFFNYAFFLFKTPSYPKIWTGCSLLIIKFDWTRLESLSTYPSPNTATFRVSNWLAQCPPVAFYNVTISSSKPFVKIIFSSCSVLQPSHAATMTLTYYLTKLRSSLVLFLLPSSGSCLHLGIWYWGWQCLSTIIITITSTRLWTW